MSAAKLTKGLTNENISIISIHIIFPPGLFCTRGKQSLECGPIPMSEVQPIIKGYGPCGQCVVNLATLKKGFTIILSDPSYKIIGFQIGYEDNNGKISIKDIFDNKVTSKNVDFLDKLEKGNFISIGCLNISKEDRLFSTTGMLMAVGK